MRNFTEIQPRRHLPNLLSLSRIALGVLFFLLFRRDSPASAAICLAVIFAGMITDYLDGTLARRNNLVTTAGKWIDPISDFSFFFFVYLSFYTASLMPLILLILFLVREVSMYTVVRPLYIRKNLDPAAKFPGKLKTVFQNVGSSLITFLTIGYQLEKVSFSTLRSVAIPLLSVMVAISLASMYWYIRPLFGSEGGDAEARRLRKRLFKPVFFTVLPLFVLFCLYTYIVMVLYNIEARIYLLYILLNGGYHGLIILASLIVAKEFRLEKNGQALKRMNLPLFLSFCRICAVPTLIFLFLYIEKTNASLVLVPLLAFIFLTDLLDGLLARSLKMTTRIGRILDAAGDYVLIFAISIVYRIIDFIPAWLFVLVIVRLGVQAVGIITLYLLRGYSYLKLSFLGKASVFSVFTIYGIELLEYLQVRGLGHPRVVTILEIITAVIVGASLLEKVLYLIRSFYKAFKGQTERNDQ